MIQNLSALGLSFFLLLIGCASTPLPLADQQVETLLFNLASQEEGEDEAIADVLLEFHSLLLESFGENLTPVLSEDLATYASNETPPLIDGFRLGLGLRAHPDAPDSAGAVVARTVSLPYSEHIPLIIQGDWTQLFPGTYERFTRVYEGQSDTDFVNGSQSRLEVINDVVNLADRGIIYAYTSESLFRRIVDARLPEGEALMHWEYMLGEAEPIQNSYSSYMRFLLNFQIYLSLNELYSWKVGVTWTEAGGSVLFFSGSANSGDIGIGIRRDFDELEAYLAAH